MTATVFESTTAWTNPADAVSESEVTFGVVDVTPGAPPPPPLPMFSQEKTPGDTLLHTFIDEKGAAAFAWNRTYPTIPETHVTLGVPFSTTQRLPSQVRLDPTIVNPVATESVDGLGSVS
jgi:hypothetical protein